MLGEVGLPDCRGKCMYWPSCVNGDCICAALDDHRLCPRWDARLQWCNHPWKCRCDVPRHRTERVLSGLAMEAASGVVHDMASCVVRPSGLVTFWLSEDALAHVGMDYIVCEGSETTSPCAVRERGRKVRLCEIGEDCARKKKVAGHLVVDE